MLAESLLGLIVLGTVGEVGSDEQVIKKRWWSQNVCHFVSNKNNRIFCVTDFLILTYEKTFPYSRVCGGVTASCACLCKQMLIWFFLAHSYMQMWPSDLHTCFACIIPTVAWRFHSCSYALDCTLWLCRMRSRYLRRPTCVNTGVAQTRSENREKHTRHVRALLWETLGRTVEKQFTLSDTE